MIIDWHTHHAENYQPRASPSSRRWRAPTGRNNHVIYEIYNEPLAVSWGGTIKPYAQAVINAIRAIDPDNLIIVGTPNWSQDVDVASRDKLAGSNIAYTLHFYAGNPRRGPAPEGADGAGQRHRALRHRMGFGLGQRRRRGERGRNLGLGRLHEGPWHQQRQLGAQRQGRGRLGPGARRQRAGRAGAPASSPPRAHWPSRSSRLARGRRRPRRLQAAPRCPRCCRPRPGARCRACRPKPPRTAAAAATSATSRPPTG